MDEERPHKKLDVWKQSLLFTKKIYDLTAKYPTQEMYGLTNQMRRAAISIASNLAEGYGRRRYKAEFIRFLVYAQASCDETIEWIEYVRDCYKGLSNEAEELLKTMNELGRKLNRFIQSVETKHQSIK